MQCFPCGRWLVGPSATLALALLLPAASADAGSPDAASRQAPAASEAQTRHAWNAPTVPPRTGWQRAPAWQRPFGWNPGWDRGHDHPGHGWGPATFWRERLCDALLAELSSHSRWGRGELLFLLFGCAWPGGSEPPEPEPGPAPDPLASPPEHTLRDASGGALADLGSVDIDHEVIRVPFATSFGDPVVILGPPTDREADPGVAQLLDVDAQGFRVRFTEWSDPNAVHAAEAVSYLVLARGRHALSDGSEWEAGVLDLSDTGAWGDATFTAPFATPPLLFLTVQTSNEDEPLVVRARQLTPAGFQAALFEAEGADGLRGVERVGYLAVESPAGSGRLDAGAGSLPYLLRRVVADHRRVPVLSASIWLEEETTLDDEQSHADETLAFLAIGPNVFAQDLSSEDLDTAALRRAAPGSGPVLEWGTLAEVDGAWHTVPLAHDYTDPVVVVGPMSSDDGAPAVVRVRNVSPDAFELSAQSWAYLDREHGPERVFYLVVDPGIQSLGGLVVEAGHLDSSLVVNAGQESVQLPLPYADVPGVFASVMSANGTQPVMVRVMGRTSDGFRIALQPEEAYTGNLPSERLGWVSIQAGRGVTADGRVVSVFDTLVDHTAVMVPFGETLRGRFPSLVGQIGSVFGIDPVVLRYFNLAPDSVTLYLDEEQSANPETNHPDERVSIFVGE